MKNIVFTKEKITLSSVSKEWLQFNKNSLKQSTFQTYKCLIEKYIMQSKLSEISIYKLSSRDIVDFSNELLLKNLSSKTVKVY
jgi:FlaA1/EpsC-like NDP-sugar epimerase